MQIEDTTLDALKAIGIRRVGHNKYRARCPIHQGRSASLSLTVTSDGKLINNCFAGCDWRDVADAIKDIAGSGMTWAPSKKDCDRSADEKSEWAVKKIWSEAHPVFIGDPVWIYLTDTRKLPLTLPPTDIGCHSALRYYEPVESEDRAILVGEFCAMVAAVRALDGSLVGIHRTYFEPGTYDKLLSRKAKKLKCVRSGATKGGAVRLGEITDKLVVAEGIETALAASLLSGLPAWAALSATGLAALDVPDCVRELVICADNDQAGKEAAEKLADRVIHRMDVSIARAEGSKGCDWAEQMEEAGCVD